MRICSTTATYKTGVAMLLAAVCNSAAAASMHFECALVERVELARKNIVLSDVCLPGAGDGNSIQGVGQLTIGRVPRVGYQQTLTQHDLNKVLAPQLREINADVKWTGSRSVVVSGQHGVHAFTEVETVVRQFFPSSIKLVMAMI